MVAFSIWQVLRKADVVGAQAATGVSMHTGSWFSAGKLVSELVIRPRGLRDVLGVDLELGVEATLHCTAFTLSSRGRRGVRRSIWGKLQRKWPFTERTTRSRLLHYIYRCNLQISAVFEILGFIRPAKDKKANPKLDRIFIFEKIEKLFIAHGQGIH